jgi:hypothetical protein
MTPSKRLKPFMAYIEDDQHKRMKRFSVKSRIPMSQLIREAIDMRIANGTPYVDGFNAGISKAITVVSANKAAEMRFPSGKSFAELINSDLENVRMETNGEISDKRDPSDQGVPLLHD